MGFISGCDLLSRSDEFFISSMVWALWLIKLFASLFGRALDRFCKQSLLVSWTREIFSWASSTILVNGKVMKLLSKFTCTLASLGVKR